MALELQGTFWTEFNNGTFNGSTLIPTYDSNFNHTPSNHAVSTLIDAVNVFEGSDSLHVTLDSNVGNGADTRAWNEPLFGDPHYKKIATLYSGAVTFQSDNEYRFNFKIKVTNATVNAGNNMSIWAVVNNSFLARVSYVNNANINTWIDANYILSLQGLSTALGGGSISFYLVYDRDELGSKPAEDSEIFIDAMVGEEFAEAPTTFTATPTITNVSTSGASDGEIFISISGGSGDFTFLWGDATSDNPKINLIAGIYTLTITDNVTFQVENYEFEVTEPEIVQPIAGTIFEVPATNSLRFIEEITPNNCNTFQDSDNALFCQEVNPYFEKKNYFQKVANCDVFPIQFKSNYSTHLAELLDYKTDALIDTFDITLERANTGIEQQFNIRIENHGAGQSRVYFTIGGAIPIPLDIGDNFEIVNNADGFNGLYEIINILDDILIGSQYLVINKNYGIAAPSSLGEAIFTTNLLDYNVYQSNIDFGGIPNGNYYVRIQSFNPNDVLARTGVSEPINLLPEHPDTLYFEYTNIDNAFDIDYQTGIIHKIRVESRMFKRIPASTQEKIRNTDGELNTLIARPQRKFLLEFFQLPPYLHEKLAVLFNHDTIRIQGVEFGAEEGLGEPVYLTRYPLANSQITIEQKTWFTTYNSDDVGGVDGQQGAILANGGFILR